MCCFKNRTSPSTIVVIFSVIGALLGIAMVVQAALLFKAESIFTLDLGADF